MAHATRLFAFTSWLLKAGFLFCLGVVALLLLSMGAIAAASLGAWTVPIPETYTHGVGLSALLAGATMVVAAAALCMALYALILLLIGRVVDSARAEDPFVAKNANRLNVIGTLLLVLQGVGLTAQLAVAAMPPGINKHLHVGFGLSLSGLFAALLVFALAQVFRHGAELRAELEGTV